MNLLPSIRILLAPALLLPMVLAVLFGLMSLLTSIDDTTGAAVVRNVGWICLVLWMVNIAALAILSAVELLMRDLSKTVPDTAHILFGAAVDDSMGDSLSVTIISSLPEEQVVMKDEEEEVDEKKDKPKVEALEKVAKAEAKPEVKSVIDDPKLEVEPISEPVTDAHSAAGLPCSYT